VNKYKIKSLLDVDSCCLSLSYTAFVISLLTALAFYSAFILPQMAHLVFLFLFVFS
jgi:hypothetical protein